MALSTTQQASLDALRKKWLTDQEIWQKTAQFANQTWQQWALNTLISNIWGMQNNPNNVIQPDSTISKWQWTSSVQIPQWVSYQDMTPAERAQYETVYWWPPKPTVATSKTPVINLWTDGKPVTTDSNTLEYNETNLNDALVQNSVDATKLTDAQKRILAQAKIDMLKTGKWLWDLFKTPITTWITTTTSINPVEDVLKSQKTEAEKQLEAAKQSETDKNKTLLNSYDADATARKNAQAIDLQNSYNRASENQRRILAASWVINSSYGAQAIGDIDKQYAAQQQALNTKFDLERQIYQAKLQWESDDKIKALQTNINEINKNIAESQLNVAQKIADLKEKTKLSNADALKLFVNSLDDQSKKDLASKYDEKLSEKLWYAVDVYGKPLVDANWNKMSFAVKSVDADAIEQYAEWVANWSINISSVPENMRNKVIVAAWAKAKDNWNIVLSPLQEIQARDLSVKLFWKKNGADKNNVNYIKSLINKWQSISEIEKDLRMAWYAEWFSWEVKDAFNKMTTKYTNDQREAAQSTLEDLISDYWKDSREVKEFIQWLVLDKADADTRQKVQGKTQTLEAIWKIKNNLDQYIAKGWNTDVLTKMINKWEQALWYTSDPELAKIMNDIALAVQAYRQSVSWAAFSDAEAKEYASVFPNAGNIPQLNQAKINSLVDVFRDYTNAYYSQALWKSTFDKIYSWDILPTLVPWLEWSTWFKNDELSEIKSLKGGWSNKETGWNFKTGSGKSFNINFSGAGQAAWTTEIPQEWFTNILDLKRTGKNVAKDTNNPWNITADSIAESKREEYGKKIWATWTYKSPNWRIYYVFPNIEAWQKALEMDIRAKTTWQSKRIDKDAPLNEFVRIYTWNYNAGYLNVLKQYTWATNTTPISKIDPKLLTEAIMKAEWFTS